MRTPAAGGNFTVCGRFAGVYRWRTISNKEHNRNRPDTLTVNKLIMDGGNIAWNGNVPATIAGNIQVGPNGMTVYSRAVSQ